MDTARLVEALYAIGIGLVIGLEREHRGAAADLDDDDIPAEQPARKDHPWQLTLGARTMALLGLVGWLLSLLGEHEPWLLPIGLVAVVALIGVQKFVSGDHGMTTEVAGVIVVLLGALVREDRALAVALALGTTLLLVSKPWMQRFVGQLRRIEITATLQLVLLAAIVLPLLPSAARDPWGAWPPRKIGTFIVLIAGIEYVGYVLTRLLGAARGTGLAGLVGGMASSTAVTVSMARAARADAALVGPGQLATFLANTVMPVRIVVIAWAIAPPVGQAVAIPLAAMALTLLVAALVTWIALRRAPRPARTEIKLRNPFAIGGALLWGAILCAVLLVARLAVRWFGESGLYVAAGLGGLTDVDAITLAAAEEGKAGTLAAPWAALAIAIAATANTIAKGAMAYFGGGPAFGRRVVVVFALAMAATIAAAAVTLVAR